MRSRAWIFALLAACGAPQHVAAPPLVTSSPSPDVDALVEELYGAAPPPLAQLRAHAAAAVARHPDDGRAHEAAALAALLAGDADACERELMAAAADLRSDAAELYLSLSEFPSTAGELRAWHELLTNLAAHHPRPAVRALATFRLMGMSHRRGRLEDAQRLARALGFVAEWKLAGGFDNDQGKGFLNAEPPEKNLDFAAEMPGPLVPLAWRTVAADVTGSVELSSRVWPRESALAYLATYVYSDAERAAQLRLSTGDAVRAWCNDGLVLSEELIDGGDFDTLAAPVTLHRGWNKILVKSANRHGDWWLRARFTDGDGRALDGLQFSTAPQRYTPSPDREDTGTLPPATAEGPQNRRRFIASRLWHRMGKRRAALEASQDFLSAAPKNLLAVYFGALDFWQNEELGRTIDLLDSGVALDADATEMLSQRGHYFAQKQLVEKAQADLQAAVERNPGNREAAMRLASLYRQRGWQVDRCRVLDALATRARDLFAAVEDRASCAEALGYDDDAGKRYARALAIWPGDASTIDRLIAIAWRRDDFATVARELAALTRLDPGSPDTRVRLGDLAHRRGNHALARRYFEEAAKLLPEWPRPWERLANLEWEDGHRDAAVAAWKAARDRDPNNTQTAQRLETLQPTRLGILDGFVPDDGAIERALGRKPTKHAGSNSALLLDHEVTEVHADGSSQSVATQVQVAFTDQGRDALTHQTLSRGGTVKVLRAYSMSDKGERHEASSIRGGDVRFRNLVVGSKVVLQYVTYLPSGGNFLPGSYTGQWYFQSMNQQHEDSRWVLLVPAAKKLRFAIVGPVEKTETARDGFTIYTFSGKSIAPLVKEEEMPPAWDLLAQVDVSTVDNWDDYARWERALLTDAFRGTDKLDALTDSLIKGATSPREKLDRLFHYATQSIRYQQDYETTIAGVRPHAASAVIERGYGDCKDKAVLLIQLARRAGLELHFAILRTTTAGTIRREVPNQQFNHAIVYVPKQPGIDAPFFMDPTSDGLDMGNLRADDQGATSLVMDPQSGKWQLIDIPYQAPELQYDRHKIKIDVKSPTEAYASDELLLRGTVAMMMRHVLRNDAMAQKAFQALSSMLFPGTTLRSGKGAPKEDTHEPLSMALDIDVSSALQPEDDDWRIKLPGYFELARVMDLKTRDTPLRLGAPASSKYDVETTLPDGYRIVHAPKDYSVEHACFALQRTARVEPRRLVVETTYTRKCHEVSVAEYADFRAAVQRGVQRMQDYVAFGKAVAVEDSSLRQTTRKHSSSRPRTMRLPRQRPRVSVTTVRSRERRPSSLK
jgi:cellulose synthase operon protein C